MKEARQKNQRAPLHRVDYDTEDLFTNRLCKLIRIMNQIDRGKKLLKKIRDKTKEWNEKGKRKDQAKVEALCEHFKQMGLNATVVKLRKRLILSYWYPGGTVIGAAKIVGRNTDLIELAWYMLESGGTSDAPIYDTVYRCNYVVWAKVEGLEDWLKVESKSIRKGLLKGEIVDFKWQEEARASIKLAQVLNSDSDLKHYFLSQRQPPNVKIEPYGKHHCIRIWDKHSHYKSPEAAFPTAETFEAFDRIAHHVRSIARVEMNNELDRPE